MRMITAHTAEASQASRPSCQTQNTIKDDIQPNTSVARQLKGSHHDNITHNFGAPVFFTLFVTALQIDIIRIDKRRVNDLEDAGVIPPLESITGEVGT